MGEGGCSTKTHCVDRRPLATISSKKGVEGRDAGNGSAPGPHVKKSVTNVSTAAPGRVCEGGEQVYAHVRQRIPMKGADPTLAFSPLQP